MPKEYEKSPYDKVGLDYGVTMQSVNDPDPARIGEANRLYQDYLEIVRDIEREPDPRICYRRSTELAERLRKLADLGAYFRARTVERIREEEKLSGEQLAQQLGVSKQRISQLLKTAAKELEDLE